MSPILIGGCGSSGTTLLREILNAHPNIHCGTELNLFNNKIFYDEPFCYTRSKFLDLLDNRLKLFKYSIIRYGYNVNDICKMAEDSDSFNEFANQIIKGTLRKTKKSIWIEKSPSNCRYIKSFKDFFPNVKYIHVVRDGRDCAISLVKRGWTLENAVRRWLYDTLCGVPFRGDKNYIEIKYEDLVTNPSGILLKLYQFIDVGIIDFDSLNISNDFSDKYQKTMNGITFYSEYKKSWNYNPTDKISDQGISKWKKVESSFLHKMERLFKFMYVSKKVRNELQIKSKMNCNHALKLFGYDFKDGWNSNIGIDLYIIYFSVRVLFLNIIKKIDMFVP